LLAADFFTGPCLGVFVLQHKKYSDGSVAAPNALSETGLLNAISRISEG
jgi:hypothetical protein